MASTDATPIAIKGQAFRCHAVIIDILTQCPLTGGLTSLTAQISKDGAAFSGTGVTATEIGTTGYVTVDINAAGMTADGIILRVDSADANAVEWSAEIVPEDMSDQAGRADAESVLRWGQFFKKIHSMLYNKHEKDGPTYRVKMDDGTTNLVTGTVTENDSEATRGHLS